MSTATTPILTAVLFLGALLLGGCSMHESQTDRPQSTQPKPAQPKPEKETLGLVRVGLETSLGLIVIELDGDKAPLTTTNFLAYLDRGFYDDTIFHRIVPDFVIQGGGHLVDLTEKDTDKPVRNEWRNGLSNVRGTIAMAREGNQPHSATSQFYINLKDNLMLNEPRDGAGYAVFGTVVEGMDVVDKIAAVPTGAFGQYQGVPTEPVLITRAYRLKD